MMEKSTGEGYYYIKDRRYSVTALTDDTGQIVETYEYSAFGHMMILDSGGTVIAESGVSNTYGYTGRRWDNETGLWYYRNRMYSPALGRFLQRDPSGYVDGMNLYAYVMNNPLAYLDPKGLESRTFQISTFPTHEYQGNLSDWTITAPLNIPNYVANDVINVVNPILTGAQNAANYGWEFVAFDKAIGAIQTVSNIGESIKSAWNYLTDPNSNILSDAFNFVKTSLTTPDNYSRAIAIGFEGYIGTKVSGIGSRSSSVSYFDDFASKKTEVVQRWMSRGELESIRDTGVLSRGGRPGPHYVTDAANTNALRARQRLALPKTPEVRVTLEVPKNTFSSPSKVKPDFKMSGGGLERTAPGHLDIPVEILKVD